MTRRSIRWNVWCVVAVVAVVVISATGAAAATSVVSKPGPPVPGTGVGTKAALAGPNCDATTGTVKFDRGTSLPCVVRFKAGSDNGGATALGVTDDSIKVVVYGKSVDQQTASDLAFKPNNLATGGTGTIPDMYEDMAAVFEHAYELYGRKVEFEFVYQTGADEAAQRADAVAVAAKKPFAVLGGGPVFARALAAKKILVITGGTNQEMEAQQPYRESAATDVNVPMVGLSELIAKSLKGRPAKWAGDADFQNKPRVFGIVNSTSATGWSVDIDLFKRLLTKAGVKPASQQEFSIPTDPTQVSTRAQEQAPTTITKLRDAGVTSVILLNTDYNVDVALTKAATQQDYGPEWLVAGVGYEDVDLVGRFMDQDQWAHAFGIGATAPSSAKATTNTDGTPVDSTSSMMTWYYGPNQGTYNIGPLGELGALYRGIHMAGPNLTAANMRQGTFAVPAAGGALDGQVLAQVTAFGRQLKLPFPQYATGGDVALIYWDKDVSGTSNVVASEGQGMWRRLDGAKRYLPGGLPSTVPKFFDPTDTVTEFTTIPASDQQRDPYPCEGCPSSTPGA